ncbi:hypothetical protein Poli38472_002556 [Pythium oligandrum]|uniref:rRNA biogenesis protein RRP36 n=1 Tax=Pythium oligandrum TaxID=41045 RepID=A0A8K1FH79_PYTOL|nr:hypothetical protein Poli38472_002556 [Pythium oligandrum]|eukprot:TMW63615.1 hypothetical protein Poli38472_002556 [Pythium oligandrum]
MARMRDTSERDVPLEERLRRKKMGYETRPTEEHGDSDSDGEASGPALKKRRANKNCPLEITSKRAVSRHRQAVEVKKKKTVDPRFESTAGRLNEDLFGKSYAFLDEYKQSELQDMKKQMKRAKSKTRKEELKQEINLRAQDLAEKQKKEKIKTALSKRKREEREAVASGKSAFYLKRKDKKKVELHAKFKDLQETGKLSKFMAKKRKKNASKDHRWLPTNRKS